MFADLRLWNLRLERSDEEAAFYIWDFVEGIFEHSRILREDCGTLNERIVTRTIDLCLGL